MSLLRRLFKRHPFLANTAVYGTMFVSAEVCQQTVLKKLMVKRDVDQEPLDKKAVLRYAAFGYGIASPILYAWYKWLDSRFIGTSALVISKKLFLDVGVMGPAEVFIFFTSMSAMEQREDIWSELREKYIPTVLKEIYFWVPAQLVNFIFLPPAVRVAFVGVCSFVWMNILCWVKREESSVAGTTPAVAESGTHPAGGSRYPPNSPSLTPPLDSEETI